MRVKIDGSVIETNEIVGIIKEDTVVPPDPSYGKTVIMLRGIGGVMTVYRSVDWVCDKLGIPVLSE